jgi:hypothetical protein
MPSLEQSFLYQDVYLGLSFCLTIERNFNLLTISMCMLFAPCLCTATENIVVVIVVEEANYSCLYVAAHMYKK